MKKIFFEIPPSAYYEIMTHLLPEKTMNEQAAFIYAKTESVNGVLRFNYIDSDLMLSKDFVYHSDFYLELRDEKRAEIIKRAHDLDASLTEWHSHPLFWPATFSKSDLLGFREFVPHVMWRLKGRPYAAVVVTPSDFDALVWSENPKIPYQLNSLKVGSRNLYPTGLTLQHKRKQHVRKI